MKASKPCQNIDTIEQDLSWGQVQEANKSRCFDHRQNYREINIEGPEKPEGPEHSKVAPPVATTSPRRPVFRNTKSFRVKSELYLEPLVNNHLS